jgi:hypothetical protein
MMGDPDFLPRGATHVRVCGFCRMEFANANEVYRKSGGSPTIAFLVLPAKAISSCKTTRMTKILRIN